MHSQCFANGLSAAIMVRNLVAITFSRLKKKPVRLSTQHHCKIESYTICKSKFALKIISIAFQANPNHVLETISSVDALNIGQRNSIQRSLNVYFSAVLLISNQLYVF